MSTAGQSMSTCNQGTVESFTHNKASWHKQCHQKFNNSMLHRILFILVIAKQKGNEERKRKERKKTQKEERKGEEEKKGAGKRDLERSQTLVSESPIQL